MASRLIGSAIQRAQTLARQPVTLASVTKTVRGIATTMQHTLTVVGLSALALAGVLYARPDVAHRLSQHLALPQQVAEVKAPALSALMEAPAVAIQAEEVEDQPAPVDDKVLAASSKQQEFVTNWLSKRYRVANDATNMLVSTAYVTARDLKLDPLLILAVMAIESRLNPFAESPVGAQGLMQVMSKVHSDRFKELGGTQAALNPVANIRVGAQILKEYVSRGGSVEAGLKSYVGAAAFETDNGYGSKVMKEYHMLKLVAKGKNVPTFTKPTPAPAPAAAPAPVPEPVQPAPQSEAIAGL